MIRNLGKVFILDTKNTTYVIKILPTGQLEHLYYGTKIYIEREEDVEVLVEKHAFAPGNTNIYDQEHPQYSLEDMRLEMSSYGKGDIREPFIEIVHADGGMTDDFVFDSFSIISGKTVLETLPSSYDDDMKVDELIIYLKDRNYTLSLELHYSVFEGRDVIVRSSKFINTSEKTIKLKRLMSTQLDFETNDLILSTFKDRKSVV